MTAENVALLFTDIVGSTELSQRLTPELADQVRRDHFAILRNALSETGGTEVKKLGDGLMAVFSSASAALDCGVAMQQAVELGNRGLDHAIQLRVGLSGGEVAHEEDDYFGDPVIEAARLCAACDPGQILASEVVPMMAGRRSRLLDVRPLGGLQLKGFGYPVPTVEILWAPVETVEPAIPLPSRLGTRNLVNVNVVGREPELSLLADAAKRVSACEGREVVLVSGEAGQGKTTLVAEAARSAIGNGACVLFGHCEEELATPYQLFVEAFAHYAGHADEDRLRGLVELHGSEWGRLVPTLAERIPDLPPSKATDPDSERYLLFAAAAGLLTDISQDHPVLLVFDDLQWADSGSLALLRHVTATEHPMRVLVLGTFRDSELPQSPELRDTLGLLWRHQGVSRVELGGLDRSGVLALMEGVAGHPLDAIGVGLAEAVFRETDGNPFFVTEVLRHLRDIGAIHQDVAGRWVASGTLDKMALPASVRDVIGGRVVRLGPDAERVLSTAAIIGRDFDLDVLGRATRIPTDALLDILDSAAASSLVSEADDAPGRYSFGHALFQHTLYENLRPARRARLHEVVAMALEDFCGDRPGTRVGELARHWINAPAGNLAKAVRYSHEAADAALRSLAPEAALRNYATALELCAGDGDADPVLLLDLAIGLGTAQRQTGDPSFRSTLLDAARRAASLGDVDRLVAACLANDRGLYSAVGATDGEKVEALELALGLLPPAHPDRALVLATLCSELAHGSTLDRRRALAEAAIDIAEASGDDVVVVKVLNHLHLPLQVPSMLEWTEARATEGLVRAERIGDPVLTFWAAQWRAESAARTGDLDEMDRCIAIHGAMAEQLNQPVFAWGHAFVRSLRAQIAGDTDVAEQHASEALDIGTKGGQPDASTIFGGQYNIISGQRGTQSELVPLIEKLAAETPDIPRAFFLSVMAKAHVEGDRRDRAADLLEEFAAGGYELPLDQLWLTGMVDFAEAAFECADPAHAAALFKQLEPWADQLPATGGSALGPVSHYLGGLTTVLGRYDEADAYFARSAAMCDRMGARFFAARTDLLWARMLLQRDAPDDVEKARALLTSAHEVAAGQSYGVVERRAAASLMELG